MVAVVPEVTTASAVVAVTVPILLLNVFQSVLLIAPVVVVFAVAIEMTGVVVPEATDIGKVPDTEVTVPPVAFNVLPEIESPVPNVIGVMFPAPRPNKLFVVIARSVGEAVPAVAFALMVFVAIVAKSALATVPSKMCVEVTFPVPMVGFGYVPVKSPPADPVGDAVMVLVPPNAMEVPLTVTLLLANWALTIPAEEDKFDVVIPANAIAPEVTPFTVLVMFPDALDIELVFIKETPVPVTPLTVVVRLLGGVNVLLTVVVAGAALDGIQADPFQLNTCPDVALC